MKKLLILSMLTAGSLIAQQNPGIPFAPSIMSGSALPTQCINGNLFYDATTYQWANCGPINNWNLFSYGASGSSVTNFLAPANSWPNWLIPSVTLSTTTPTLSVTAVTQGNGGKVQLSTGSTTSGDCVKFDANGNTIDAGSACGGVIPTMVLDTSAANIQSACTTAGPNGYVQLTVTNSIASNTTLNCNLWPLGGKIQTASSAVTVAFSGKIFGPNSTQVWDTITNGGHIDISQNTIIAEVTPLQYGAKCDASTDDTISYNEMFRSLMVNQAIAGRPLVGVLFPSGCVSVVTNVNATLSNFPSGCQSSGATGCYTASYIHAQGSVLKAKSGSTGYVFNAQGIVLLPIIGLTVDGNSIESCMITDFFDVGPSLGDIFDTIRLRNCNGSKAWSAANNNDTSFDKIVIDGTGGGNSAYSLYLNATGGGCGVGEINAITNKVYLNCQEISLGVQGGKAYLAAGLELGNGGLNHTTITNTQIEQAPDTHISVNCTASFYCSNIVFINDALAPSGLSTGGFIFNGPFAYGVIFEGGRINVGSGAMYGNITTPQNGYFPLFDFRQAVFDIDPPIPSTPSGTTGLYARYDQCEKPSTGTIYPYTDTRQGLAPLPVIAGTNITATYSNIGVTLASSGGAQNYQANGTGVGSGSTLNFIPGSYITQTVSCSGGICSYQPDADTTKIPTNTAIQAGQLISLTTTSTSSSVYVAAPSSGVALTAYVANQFLIWNVGGTACAGGAMTLNISSLGAISLKQDDGITNLTTSQCLANTPVSLIYDATNVVFRSIGTGQPSCGYGLTTGNVLIGNSSGCPTAPGDINVSGGVISLNDPTKFTALVSKNCLGTSGTGLLGGCSTTIGDRLRSALASASASNPIINNYLVAPPAWQALTAYSVPNIVSNGGNLYVCYTAGTSAASTGPTGTGEAITDGGVTWYFYSAAPVTSGIAPIITTPSSVPSGLTLQYAFPAKLGDFQFYGGTAVVNQYNGVYVKSVTEGSTGNTDCGGVTNPVTPLIGCSSMVMSFWSDAPKIDILGPLGASVIINGQYAVKGITPPYSGGTFHNVFDFSGARAPRLYSVACNLACSFASVYVDPASKIWAPQQTALKLQVFGDSLTAGAVSFPSIQDDYWPSQLGYRLGIPNVINSAIGGTGYLATDSGAFYNFLQHISDIGTIVPDVLIFSGGYNDSNTGLQAQALAVFQAARVQAPNAVIIVTGVYGGATGPSAAVLANEASILAAFNSWADPNSYYIPISDDPNGAWITGTGYQGATTGTGNSDVYTSTQPPHPVNLGINHMADRFYAYMQSIIQQIP